MTSTETSQLPAATREEQIAMDPADPASNRGLDHESIARLAYDYWLTRGCADGLAQQDWLRAEHDLLALRLAVHSGHGR